MQESHVTLGVSTIDDWRVCIRGICIRGICIRDICIRGICVRDICIRDICIRDICILTVYYSLLDMSKDHGIQLKASTAMLRLRIYQSFLHLLPQTYEGIGY